MVEGAGFEPAKHEAADLQSAGFDRSPTPPRLQKLGNSACAQLPCQLKLNYLLFFAYKRSKKIDLLSKKEVSYSSASITKYLDLVSLAGELKFIGCPPIR